MRGVKHIRITILLVLLFQIHQQAFGQKTKISESYVNQPLTEILSSLSSKYNIKLAFDPIALAGISFTGQFRNDSPEKVLRTILANTDFEFIVLAGVYVLKRRELVQEKPKPIQGIVRDRVSGEALPYASVRILDKSIGTTTNPDGFFSIADVKSDTINIEVRYLGFEPIQLRVARIEGGAKPLIVELDPKAFRLPDVEVVKKLFPMVTTGDSPGEMVINTKSVADIPSISGVDILAPLQLLPGVDGTTESLSGLLVRHSPADKNLISYDGFTIYHIDHLFGAFSSLNSKAIKDVRLYRGGFDSRWGGRASSVIEITGKTGNENGLCADIGSDQLAGDITLEGPLSRHTSFILSARRSYTDFYRSPQFLNLFESAASDLSLGKQSFTVFGSNANDPSYKFYDANAKISIKPSENDVISATGYLGRDQLSYFHLSTSPFVQENALWGNRGTGLRWARQWGSSFYHNLTLGLSDFKSDFTHADSTLKRRSAQMVVDTIAREYITKTNLSDISANLNALLNLTNEITLELGAQSNLVDVDIYEKYKHSVNSTYITDTIRQNYFYSALYTGWMQISYKTKGLKSLNIGGRLNYHNLTDSYYFEPRFQMVISPTAKVDLKFAAGLYNQFVNRIYVTGNGVRYLWVASDGGRYPVVKSKHLIAGFAYNSNGLTIDAEGYVKETNGLSFIQNVIKRTTGNQFVNQSRIFYFDSRSFGFDLLIRKSWKSLESWISYSLSQSFNQSSNLNGGDEYFALDDHLHEFKTVCIYKWRKWRAVGSWIYGTPKPWDELLLLSNLTLSPEYEKNSSRLVPYHRLDLGLSYQAKIFSHGNIELGIKVFNAYNRQNILGRPYALTATPMIDYLQGRSIIEYHDIYGYSITPTLYFNVKF